MNKQRRERIQEVVDQIGVLCQELEELRDEEQDYMDNKHRPYPLSHLKISVVQVSIPDSPQFQLP